VDAPDASTRLSPRMIAVLLLPALILYVPWALDKTATFDLLPPVAWALVVHLACAASGYALVVRRLPQVAGDDLERLALGWWLGAGLLGTGMTLLAFAGLFNLATAGTLLAALAVVPVAVVRPPVPTLPTWAALPAVMIAAVTAGAMVMALAPPLFHDTLTYHLALPMHAAAAGGAEVSVTDVFSAYPPLGEMTSSPALLLGSPVAMAVTHAGFLFPLALLAAAFARRFLDDTGAAVALVVVTCPLVLFAATTLKPDLLMFGFTLTALFALASLAMAPADDAVEHHRQRVLLVGAAVGLMCATRVTGLAWGVVLLVALAVVLRRRSLALAWRLAAPAFGLAAVVGAPVYLRNLLALGNPVFPLMSSIFGGPAWMPRTAAALDGMARRADAEHVVELVVKGPLTFTFDNPGSMNDIPGTLPLLLLPLGLLLKAWPRPAKLVLGLALVSLPLWLATHALMRLNPLLVLGLLLGTGWVLGRLAQTSARPLVAALVLTLAAGNLLWTLRADALLRRDPWAVITARTSADEHLRQQFELYGAFAWLNNNTPPTSRVLLFTGDWRSGWLQRRVVRSGRLTKPVLQSVLEVSSTVDDMVREMKALDVDYVVFTPGAVAIEQKAGWMDVPQAKLELLDAFIKHHAPPAYADRYTQVFVLVDQP
jgi:tetrahydromethanopterin S-methyltransferase subunit F